MIEREKVIRGLEWCIKLDGNGCSLECPYLAGKKPCPNVMLRDALALLKEQEPHLLTLEECRNPERMVALEYKTYGILQGDELKPVMTIHKWAVYIGKCFDGDIEWTAFSLFHAFTNQMTLKTDNYGKTWRCWSADPGDEVREETKWDD